MAINKNKVMEVAQRFVEKGQIDKAIREYQKIVDEDPKDVRVWLKIGDLYAKKNAKKEATSTYLRVAAFYSEQGFFLKAVAVYKQVLRLDPRLVEVNLKLADVYRQLGLLSEAVKQLEAVAAFHHREGNTKEALAAVRQLVDLDPENVATRIKLAELYSKEGMTQAAVAEFAKAAEYLRAHHRADDFVKVAERLVWHQPENATVQRELAALYLRRNDPRHALQKLQAAFKADPRDVETLSLLAQAFLALDQKPKTVSVWKELATIHVENGQRAQAQEVYRKIVTLAPDDPEALTALGAPRAAGPPSTHAPSAAAMSGTHSADVSRTASRPAAPLAPPRPPPAGSGLMPAPPPAARVPAVDPLRAPPRVEAEVDLGAFDVEDTNVVTRPTGDIPAMRRSGVDQLVTGDDELLLETGVDLAETHADQIDKILSEADVYRKYALHPRAIEHLQKIFDLDPRNLEARLRLKELYLDLGRPTEAVGELAKLADLTAVSTPELAEEYAREAMSIDGNDSRARALAARFHVEVPEGVDDEGLDELAAHPPVPNPFAAPTARSTVGLGPVAAPVSPAGAQALVAPVGGPPLATAPLGTSAPAPRPGGPEALGIPPLVTGALPSTASLDLDLEELAAAAPEVADGSLDATPEPPPGVLAAHDIPIEAIAFIDDDEIEEIPYDGVIEEITEFDEIEEVTGEDLAPVGADDAGTPGEEPALVAAPDAETAVTAPPLDDELDEVAFYASQGMLDEARALLDDLLARHPGHPQVRARLDELEAAAPPAPPAPAPAPRRPAVIAQPHGVDDAETHYDLGLAYKEMGLYDEAIREFLLVRDAPGRAVQCHLMIGLCHAERGEWHEAVSAFKQGLYVDGITDRESLALYFELGAAYEALRDTNEALFYFRKVLKRDPHFRDVQRRVDALEGGPGGVGVR